MISMICTNLVGVCLVSILDIFICQKCREFDSLLSHNIITRNVYFRTKNKHKHGSDSVHSDFGAL